MSKKKEKSPRSWIVTMRCTVVKEVICDNCTEEQATDDPWQYCVDERELDQPDWEVRDVSPNE